MDAQDVALRVARGFDAAGILYFLGGSMASSLQGEPRTTNDIDFVVDMRPDQVDSLKASLGPDFDVDEVALREALDHRSSWNIFFLPLVTRIDLFAKGTSAFDESEFSRRRPIALRGQILVIKSPEDSILRKLVWFRKGGGVSSTQMRDVAEVLRVNRASLDRYYLESWSARLGVNNLLERAESLSDRK